MSAAEPETLVLLHGFAGTHRTWDGVVGALDPQRYRPLALDLRGHGAHGDRRPIDFEACVADVLACAPGRFSLCGYSMGGRLALHVALAEPGRVGRLALIGANPGIEDPVRRAERREADERLADRIEREDDIEQFADAWRGQPLFSGDPAWVAAAAREDYRRNRPAALAAALRGIGTGVMDPLWGRLAELRVPVLVVVGERDPRYREIGERLAQTVADGRVVVLPGGHAVHLESPAEVADAISA